MSTVFVGKISPNSPNKEPIAGDGAASIKWVNVEAIEQEDFGFDPKNGSVHLSIFNSLL
jgi:8-oxo-dGTP diphosphatase